VSATDVEIREQVISPPNPVATTVSDILAVTRRNLLRYVRVPSLLVFSTIQPVMFVLLFRYVFGNAIRLPFFPYP